MNEQIRIKEETHFYTEKKDIADRYAEEKRKQGCKVKVNHVNPIGYIVMCSLWIVMNVDRSIPGI